jgi:hypothetical protein
MTVKARMLIEVTIRPGPCPKLALGNSNSRKIENVILHTDLSSQLQFANEERLIIRTS